MKLSGFGKNLEIEAAVYNPASIAQCRRLMELHKLCIRGNGQSYGDSSLSSQVIVLNNLHSPLTLDKGHMTLKCRAGMTIRELMHFLVPQGLSLPVLPGSSLVTVGGAIASDIHGKNHVQTGCFSNHVQSLNLLLGTGEMINISEDLHPELNRATCGGMGLTGLITEATLKLVPLSSSLIKQTKSKFTSFRDLFEKFEEQTSDAVAWINSTTFSQFILTQGEGSDEGPLTYKIVLPPEIPQTESCFLNNTTLRVINSLHFNLTQDQTSLVSLSDFHFPLEKITGWQNILGPSGLLQIHFVLPLDNAYESMLEVLNLLKRVNERPLLCSMKKMGQKNRNYLSFPLEGYSLALDFRNNPEARRIIGDLERIVLQKKGKIYLTKDSTLGQVMFNLMYSEWEEFESIRALYGALGKFSSLQSLRLGLR